MRNCLLEQLVLTPTQDKTTFKLVRCDQRVLMEILHHLLHLARESCVQVRLLRDCRRGNPVWKWARLKFSIMIREAVSSRLRTKDEWKKPWQRSRQLWHLPRSPGILKRSVSGHRGQSSVFWGRVGTLPCVCSGCECPTPPSLAGHQHCLVAMGSRSVG